MALPLYDKNPTVSLSGTDGSLYRPLGRYINLFIGKYHLKCQF